MSWIVLQAVFDKFSCDHTIFYSLHFTNRCREDCDKIKNNYIVVAGAHNRRIFEKTKQYRKVIKCKWWGYKDHKANDIALLILKKPLDIRAGDKCKRLKDPLCTIGLMGAPVRPLQSTTATGWGASFLKVVYRYSKCFIRLPYSTTHEPRDG